MSTIPNNIDINDAVLKAIKTVLEQKQESTKIKADKELSLTQDLGFNSLDLAQFSALLEDTFGVDPYTEGEVPQTLKEVVSYYNNLKNKSK
jgi:acyl carrier protein